MPKAQAKPKLRARKGTYDELDELLIKRINKGWRHFNGLNGQEVRDAAERLERAGFGESWRIVDRRLQVLRKVGRVTFGSKSGWRVMESQDALV